MPYFCLQCYEAVHNPREEAMVQKRFLSPVPNAVVGVYLYFKQPTDDDVNERDFGVLPLSWHFCLDGTISRSHG